MKKLIYSWHRNLKQILADHKTPCNSEASDFETFLTCKFNQHDSSPVTEQPWQKISVLVYHDTHCVTLRKTYVELCWICRYQLWIMPKELNFKSKRSNVKMEELRIAVSSNYTNIS